MISEARVVADSLYAESYLLGCLRASIEIIQSLTASLGAWRTHEPTEITVSFLSLVAPINIDILTFIQQGGCSYATHKQAPT